MFQNLLGSSTLPLLRNLAVFAERRQDVLTGNIANISTPDYKTQDLPVSQFQETLNQAVLQRVSHEAPGDIRWSFRNSINSANTPQFPAELFEATKAGPNAVTFQDGGNRSIEHEVMEMTKNSQLFNTAVELMKIQFSRIQAVITERP